MRKVKFNHQECIFQSIFILTFLISFSFAYSDNCSLGCSSCSTQNSQTSNICTQCDKDFLLQNSSCKYLQCPPNTYLQISKETGQQDGKIKINKDCQAICNNSYQENSDLNVCETQEQCSVSYSQSINSSVNVGQIESIYIINSMYSMIVYPTYVTIINTRTGQYLRDVITSTTLSTLYFKNYLIILSTKNEIIEWIFENNFQRLITKVSVGKLTKKSQFFDLGQNLQAISSYDDIQSIVYFTRIYLEETNIVDIQEDIPSFTFEGCALKIVENFVFCFGKGQKIKIKVLSFKNKSLTLEDQIQQSSCLNQQFISNSIIQSTLVKQNNFQYILLVQSQNSSLIELIYDQVGTQFDCKLQDLLDQPQQIRLLDQKNLQFLFVIQFVSNIIFYNQDLSNCFRLTTNSITDFAFVRDQSVQVLTTYKMLVMISTQNIVQTYNVNVETKTITELSKYQFQISNSLFFMTYNNKSIQKDQIQTIQQTDNYNIFIANDKIQSINAITDQTNYIVTPYQQPKFNHKDIINEMVHIDDFSILITCSSDGQVKAWNTLNGYNPFHSYSVKQNNESCRTVLVHQNKWVIALYSRSILIFQLKNQFVRYSYSFLGPTSDQMQFISQITSHILLFYDYQFVLLRGSDLTEIKRSKQDSNFKVISMYFIENFNIIIQSQSNLLEAYQFDQNNNYQFIKKTYSYLSSYGDFTFIQTDQLNQEDFEILLGCKQNAMIILNNQLTQVLFIKIAQGYPISIKNYKDKYIIFGQSTEPNTIYLFFSYYVDRTAKLWTIMSRNYQLKHNEGIRPLLNYKNQEEWNFIMTMTFSYFSLILNCIFGPIDQKIRYGYSIYSIGKPITKYAIRNNNQIQYYGTSDGALTIGITDYSTLKRLILNQNITTNPIKKVIANGYLKSLFVIHTQVDIYSLHTHDFLSQIKFDSQLDTQQVSNILISEKNFIVIAYKNSQLIVRNLIDNSDKQITTIRQINGVLLDENNKNFYIYGTSIKKYMFDMTLVSTISDEGEGQMSYQQCLLTENLLICKANTNTLIIYNKKTYSILASNLIKNQPNTFKIYIDEANSQIYLATSFIQVFNFNGVLLSQIQSISQIILDIQIFGNHLCILSSACNIFKHISQYDLGKQFKLDIKFFYQIHKQEITYYIFVFTRNNLTLMKQFKPTGGGNILGYYYIQDYNLIVYYADEIRFGQLFYFSLNNYLDDGFSLSSYSEMGIGRVVSLFYDNFTSRLNYVDSLGNLNSLNFLSQRSYYNDIKFEDFTDFGSPTNHEIEYVFNKLYIYNQNIIMPFNYNVIPKFVIQQNKKEERFYFKYLPSTSTSKIDSKYFIFDSNNVLYSYKDYSQIYQTYFTNPVRNVKQLDKYQIVLIIFENEILLFNYEQISSLKIQSSNYKAKISDPKVSVFLTNDLIFTTEQKLIHINYFFYQDGTNNWKKNMIDFSQSDESLISYFKFGVDLQEKILISLNSGRVILYDISTMQTKIIQQSWSPQSGLTTNFVKHFTLSDSFAVLGYNLNKLIVLSLSNFSEVKSIDMGTITQQSTTPLNYLSIDEQNSRIFYSLMFSKLIYVLRLKTLEFEQYLSFPNDEYNRMQITSKYIFTYSIFQINIFQRDTLQFVNKIKKSSQDHRILTLTILEENKIIIAMNVLLEVYFFNTVDQSMILIDSSSLNNPEIIETYMVNNDQNILRIIGISDSSVFEKRLNIRMYTSPTINTLSTGTIKYSCYSQLNMSDRIQGENLFLGIYNKNNQNINYRISATFGEDLKSLDFIPDNSFRVIIQSDSTSSNGILHLFYNSFISLKKSSISLKNFSLKLNDKNQKYVFSSTTKNVLLQNIIIEAQELQGVQFVFSGMSKVIISQTTISQIQLNLKQDDTDKIKKWDQAFFLFVDCDTVVIDNLLIINHKMWKRSLLLGFQRVNSVQISNISILNSFFYQLIAFEKIQNMRIDTLKVNNNMIVDRIPFGSQYLQSVDYQQDKSELFMISIIGCSVSIISNVSMKSNSNILFLNYLNSYSNDNEKVTLYHDSLIIQNSEIQDTIIKADIQTPLSKLINSPILYIEASNCQLNNLNYINNQGNIQIQNSGSINISGSKFERNESLEGGSIYFNQITQNINIIKTSFTENIAKGGGGALFVKEILSITFDNQSIVTKNKAQIGGGIRIVNSETDPFSVLLSKKNIIDNTASIFGKNVGIYPTKFKISLSQSHTRLLNSEHQTLVKGLNYSDQVQSLQRNTNIKSTQMYLKQGQSQSNNFNDKFLSKKRILLEPIIFYGLRSGDFLPLNVQLLDDEDQIVTYSLENLKNQEYTQAIIDEIKSFSFEIQVVNDTNTQLSGITFLNFNQFNMTQKGFQFMALKINAKPNQMRSIKLISTTNSFYQSNQIILDIQLNFRLCERGEVFKNISNTGQIVICEVCQNEYYSLIDPSDYSETQGSFSCIKCPINAENCEKDQIVLKDGYWRENQYSDEIYECNNERFIQACKASDAASKNGCIQGYSGPICDKCDESGQVWGNRYTYVEKDEHCVQCDQPQVYYIFYIFSSIGIIIYLTVNIIMFMNNFTHHSKTNYLRYMNIIPISSSCVRDQSTEYIKSLNNYIQISSILLEFNLKSPLTQAISISNYAGSPATKVLADSHCIFTDEMIERYGVTQIKIFIQGLYPVIFLILICLIFTFLAKKNILGIKYYHNYAALTILFTQFQPELIKYFTQSLSCVKIGDKKYAFLNLLIMCDDPQYNIFKHFFILPYLIFLMVTPLIPLFQLYKNRNKLNYCINSFKFGYFYLGYKSNLYFWEFIRIYSRALMVIFYTLQKEIDIGFSYQIVSFILSIKLLLIFIFRPYKQKQVFQVETISIFVILINIVLHQIDIVYQHISFKILEYSFHITYVLLVVTVILILKLRMRNDKISLCIMNTFKYCLPEKTFNKSIKNRRIQLITFQRWLYIRKNINLIIKSQAKKIQQKNEICLSKQLTQPNAQGFRRQRRETDSSANSKNNTMKKSLQLTQIENSMKFEINKSNHIRNNSGRTDYDHLISEQSPKFELNFNKTTENDKENSILSHDLDQKYIYEGQTQSPQYQKTIKTQQSQMGEFNLDKITEGDQENIIQFNNLEKKQ